MGEQRTRRTEGQKETPTAQRVGSNGAWGSNFWLLEDSLQVIKHHIMEMQMLLWSRLQQADAALPSSSYIHDSFWTRGLIFLWFSPLVSLSLCHLFVAEFNTQQSLATSNTMTAPASFRNSLLGSTQTMRTNHIKKECCANHPRLHHTHTLHTDVQPNPWNYQVLLESYRQRTLLGGFPTRTFSQNPAITVPLSFGAPGSETWNGLRPDWSLVSTVKCKLRQSVSVEISWTDGQIQTNLVGFGAELNTGAFGANSWRLWQWWGRRACRVVSVPAAQCSPPLLGCQQSGEVPVCRDHPESKTTRDPREEGDGAAQGEHDERITSTQTRKRSEFLWPGGVSNGIDWDFK